VVVWRRSGSVRGTKRSSRSLLFGVLVVVLVFGLVVVCSSAWSMVLASCGQRDSLSCGRLSSSSMARTMVRRLDLVRSVDLNGVVVS